MTDKRHCLRDFTFRFGDCDTYKRATIYSSMKFLTELSGEDYENRGLGHTFLVEKGQTFLVTRMRLEFLRLPEYTETAIAETWEREVKGPYFYREYDVRSASGEPLIRGTSMWLLVDPVSREILRPAVLYGGLPVGDPTKTGCAPCKKLKALPQLERIGERGVYYSDLDCNGHVNNAVYGRIATDFLPAELREKPVRAIDISFNAETRLGDTLIIRGGETDGGFAVQGTAGDTLRFACELEF